MNIFQIPTLSPRGTETTSGLRPSSFIHLENFYSYCKAQLICPPLPLLASMEETTTGPLFYNTSQSIFQLSVCLYFPPD